MNPRRCQRIAERIRAQCLQLLCIDVDPRLMLEQPAYLADVLTVCDAHPDTTLAVLAQLYRVAASEPDEEGAARVVATDTVASEPFGMTRPGASSTDFGRLSQGYERADTVRPYASFGFEQERGTARAARLSPGWMAPERWLGHDT